MAKGLGAAERRLAARRGSTHMHATLRAAVPLADAPVALCTTS